MASDVGMVKRMMMQRRGLLAQKRLLISVIWYCVRALSTLFLVAHDVLILLNTLGA